MDDGRDASQSPSLPPLNFHNRFDNSGSTEHNASASQASGNDEAADGSFSFEFSDFGGIGAGTSSSAGLGAFLNKVVGSQAGQDGGRAGETSSAPTTTSAVLSSNALDANTSIAESQKSERASPETWAPPLPNPSSQSQGQAGPPLKSGQDFLGAKSTDSFAGRSPSPLYKSSASMYSQSGEQDRVSHDVQIPSASDQYRGTTLPSFTPQDGQFDDREELMIGGPHHSDVNASQRTPSGQRSRTGSVSSSRIAPNLLQSGHPQPTLAHRTPSPSAVVQPQERDIPLPPIPSDEKSPPSGEQSHDSGNASRARLLTGLSGSSTNDFANIFGDSASDLPSSSKDPKAESLAIQINTGAQTDSISASTSGTSFKSPLSTLPSTQSGSSINFSRPSGKATQGPSSPFNSGLHNASSHSLSSRIHSLDLNRRPVAQDGSIASVPASRSITSHQPALYGQESVDSNSPRNNLSRDAESRATWHSDQQQLYQHREALSQQQERPDSFFGMQSPVAPSNPAGRRAPVASEYDNQSRMTRDLSRAPSTIITDDNASDFFPNHAEGNDDSDGFFQGGNGDSGSSAEQQVGQSGQSQAARLAAAYQRKESLRSDSASTASTQNRSTLAGGTGNAYIQQSTASHRDSFMNGRPQTIVASTSGPLLDHSHLKPGQQAALLSHIKTLELYRLNAKKTNDPDLIYEFAVFMIDASKSMPDSLPGPSQAGSKEELIKEAIGLLKKIAERGQSDAQYFLADCYANGIGTPKGKQDFDRAYPLFVLAAKHGHPDAAYRAGTCYEKGWGCRKDNAKALQFYRKAAAQSHPGAMYRLATAELNGELGLKRSAKEGVKWLKRSADSATPEFPHALHELALLHERGIDNVLFLDPEYACELLAQAGEMGYAPSAYKLGVNYEYGRMGCPQDAGLSIHMYNIAAQQNHREACFALTAWYLVGAPGILPQSDTEAYLWAKKAAEQGLAKAEYAVGYFTEMGIGTVKDIREAKAWFTRAAEHGDHRANQRLANLGAPTVKVLTGVGANQNGQGKANHRAGQHGAADVTDYASLPNSHRTQPINAPFPSRIETSGMSPAAGGATTYPSPVTMRDQQSLQRETKFLANVAAHQQAQARAAANASRSGTPPTGASMPRTEASSAQSSPNNPAEGLHSTNGQGYPSFASQMNNMPVQRITQPGGNPSPFDSKPLPASTPNRSSGPPTLPSIRTSGMQQYLGSGPNSAPYSANGTDGNGAAKLASPISTMSPAPYPSYPSTRGPNTLPLQASRGTPPPRVDSNSMPPHGGPNGFVLSSTPPRLGGPHVNMLRQSSPHRQPLMHSGTPPPRSPQRGPPVLETSETLRQSHSTGQLKGSTPHSASPQRAAAHVIQSQPSAAQPRAQDGLPGPFSFEAGSLPSARQPSPQRHEPQQQPARTPPSAPLVHRDPLQTSQAPLPPLPTSPSASLGQQKHPEPGTASLHEAASPQGNLPEPLKEFSSAPGQDSQAAHPATQQQQGPSPPAPGSQASPAAQHQQVRLQGLQGPALGPQQSGEYHPRPQGQQAPFPAQHARPPYPQGPFPQRPPPPGYQQPGPPGSFRPPPQGMNGEPQRPGFQPQWQSRPPPPPPHSQGPHPSQQPFRPQPQRHQDWIPSSQKRNGGSPSSNGFAGPPPGAGYGPGPLGAYQGDTGMMTQGMLGLDSDAQAQAQIAQRAMILEQRRLAAAAAAGAAHQMQGDGDGGAADGDGAQKKKKKGWFK